MTGWDFDPGRGTNDQSGDIAGFSVVRVSVQSRTAQPHSTIILCWLRSNKKIVQRPSGLIIGDIDKEKIDATFENGILKVVMPKKEEEKSSKRMIEIK